ncbi:MAG: PQQ-binding-like beta-propeller repeat protein [Kiritimatiellaceae bacterium]|nr:PQQ-binding-like beta-propeller repeat protein [Kiritimatiellaceae bacterium]
MNEFKQRPVLALAAQSTALVAATFSLILCILLIADFVRIQKMDPLNDPHLLQLREKLAVSTGDNQALVEEVRTFDFYARRAFFSNQEQRRMGGFLLLGGASICFIALKLSKLWKPELPKVACPERQGSRRGKAEPVNYNDLNALFRQLLAGTGLLLLAVSPLLAFAVKSDLAVVLEQPVAQAAPAEQPAPAVQTASAAQPVQFMAEAKNNWPSLRGPGNIGVAHFTNAPVSWNVTTGAGVLWKTKIPLQGLSSPIIWAGRVFISGADKEGQEVFCFDADTGKPLWTKKVKAAVEFPEVTEDTGYAAPTMATDGRRVFVIFATGELAAFDLNGTPVWQKNLGVPENPYGMGSSLISDGERLFVQYDHQSGQKVMAFDGATGNPVWQTARKDISWSSPALIETAAGWQLILNDEKNVTAYDPVSGKLIWTVNCLGGEVAPSPAFNGKDIIFVANEYAKASALKLTVSTPVTLWTYDEYLPEISSPVASENLFFIATSSGDVVCLDAATGKANWEQEFKKGFSSSPVLVGDRVYVIDITGVVHIFGAEAEYKEIGTIAMGEPVFATPAFMDGRIYIRGEKNLYCVGK